MIVCRAREYLALQRKNQVIKDVRQPDFLLRIKSIVIVLTCNQCLLMSQAVVQPRGIVTLLFWILLLSTCLSSSLPLLPEGWGGVQRIQNMDNLLCLLAHLKI